MASYREEYYSHVDELFDKLKDAPFSNPIMDQTEYEISRPGSIQPVGWVRNASGDGVKSVEINIDGLAFWTSNGQRTLLYSGHDWGEIRQENIDGSNDVEYRLMGENTFETKFASRLSGDTEDRISMGISSAGTPVIRMGPGGSTFPDLNLYRSAANLLRTDDTFQAAALLTGGAVTLGSGPASLTSVTLTLPVGATVFVPDASLPRTGCAIVWSIGNNGLIILQWYRHGSFNTLNGIHPSVATHTYEARGSTYTAGAAGFSFFLESNAAGARLGCKNNAGFTTSVKILVLE